MKISHGIVIVIILMSISIGLHMGIYYAHQPDEVIKVFARPHH